MSADGGAAWVTLTREDGEARLAELLAPWWSSLNAIGGDDHGDTISRWIREHASEYPRAVFGRYGTDWEWSAQWDDLPLWVEYLDEALTCAARDLPTGATWDDLLTEIDTRPAWCGWYGHEDRDVREWLNELRDAPDAFRAQPVATWLDALRETLVYCGDVPCVERRETWT